MDSRLAQRMALINQLAPGPNLNNFLIDFGLNLASTPPRGNILSTAAQLQKNLLVDLWTQHKDHNKQKQL